MRIWGGILGALTHRESEALKVAYYILRAMARWNQVLQKKSVTDAYLKQMKLNGV
jgi:hypothetical protein